MHQHDRRSDLVEERHQRVTVEELRLGKILHLGNVAASHLQRDRIIRRAAARPLGMQMCLRPELDFLLLQVTDGESGQLVSRTISTRADASGPRTPTSCAGARNCWWFKCVASSL